MSGLETGNLLEDAKLYQDIAIELQLAYENLEHRYSHQPCLIEEASGALHAAESQASKRQQELLDLPSPCPGVVIGRPYNSAFCETYSERGRLMGGGVQLPPRHSQYKKGCCHV